MAKFVPFIIGGLEIAAGIALDFLVPGGQIAGYYLIAAGAGSVIAGVGSLLNQPQKGLAIASQSPVAPWQVGYGRFKSGGTIIYQNESGENDKFLDQVFVLACHPCQGVDALTFDNQRILFDSTGTSFKPNTQSVDISTISRANGVVTVLISPGINYLVDGDQLQITNVSGQTDNDKNLNGKFYITTIGGSTSNFTYLQGGFDVTLSGTGNVTTVWADYGKKVYMEALTGNQTSTFVGMLNGTPYDGDTSNLVTVPDNPWNPQCLAQGMTVVFLRMHYNDQIFANGQPAISFRIRGKNDIFDPRGLATTGPAAPHILVNGSLGTATYSYVITASAVGGQIGTASPAGTITNGNSSLDRHNFNAVTWPALAGAVNYNIYRTVGGATQGRIGSTNQAIWFNDSGQTGDGTTPPAGVGSGVSGGGYTENAALCIADYLANQQFGFKAQYGTEIPLTPLINAANVCDEGVRLADSPSTEVRYSCNGTFPLTLSRGAVLQNLLTSCGGRVSYSGGQFVIQPAAWYGSSITLGTAGTYTAKTPISAMVYAKATYQQGSAASGIPFIDAVYGTPRVVAIDFSSRVNLDCSTLTTTPSTISAAVDIALLIGLNVIAGIEGTLLAADTSPISTLNIYDVYLTVTYADTTTSTVRPWQTQFSSGDFGSVGLFGNLLSGQVANPQLAIDSDNTTYASIQRQYFGGLQDVAYLQMLFASPVGTPDPSASGMAASAKALAVASGPYRWKGIQIRDLYNGAKGTYVSPSNGWQPSDFPYYAQDQMHGYSNGPQQYNYDANLAADGGDRRWLDLQLPFTISYTMAQRLAKIELLRRRQFGTATFAFNMSLYQATVLDIVSLALPVMGWFSKLFEIAAHRLTVNKQQSDGGLDVTVLGCELDLQETDPGVYEWLSSEQLTAQGFQQSTLPGANTPPAPVTGLTATSGPSVAALNVP